jgi:hypothetical protein
MSARVSTPEHCPVCGEPVPPGARACPGCGADERSGWDEDAARYDGLDLPPDAADEETEAAARRQHGAGLWLVIATGLAVIVIFSLILH